MAASMTAQSQATSEAAPGKKDDNSRPSEVPLQALIHRSASLAVANTDLSQGLDSARRLDALEWLVQAFDALNLPDTHLFAAFGLLDRFAAASPGPISAGPGAFALVLAAMLIALKVSGTQKDLERAKRLVVEVSHSSSKPWPAVRRAELAILRRLQFRACTPTSRDMLDKLIAELPAPSEDWDTEAQTKFASVARFLLELGIVHEPEEFYGRGRPPLAAAVAALHLAHDVLNSPQHLVEALKEPTAALAQNMASNSETAGDAVFGALEAMRRRWDMEERRLANSSQEGAQGGAVLEKWLRRVGSLPVAPKTPLHDLRVRLLKPFRASSPRLATLSASVGGQVAGVTLPASGTTIAPHSAPTASSTAATRRLPPAVPQNQQVSQPALAGKLPSLPQELQQPTELPSAIPLHLQIPTPAKKASRPVVSARLASEQPAGAPLSHAPAVENLPSWNAVSSLKPTEAGTSVDVKAAGHSPRNLRSGAQSARAPVSSADAAETSRQEIVSDPLAMVELTQVLNMVAPRPSHSLATAATASSGLPGKQKSPTVAAELLLSSALRMQWPADKRRIGSKDAATTCREAAAVLQEAAQQLLGAAASFESNGLQPQNQQQMKPPVAEASSEHKRRRTFGFGGGSPTGTQSPHAAADGTAMPLGGSSVTVELCKPGAWAGHLRGSPPITSRCGPGLRV